MAQLHSSLVLAQGLHEQVERQVGQLGADLSELTEEASVLEVVQGLLQSHLDQEVVRGAQVVDHLLTEALKTVFPDQDLCVRSEVEVVRGRVSVELNVVQKTPDGLIEGLGPEAFGGAVTTVISVLLRVILMLRRGLRPVLILDETLPAFDVNYVHNMGAFLQTYCKRAGLDVLLVTHNQALVDAADVAYKLTPDKNNGVKVTTLKAPPPLPL